MPPPSAIFCMECSPSSKLEHRAGSIPSGHTWESSPLPEPSFSFPEWTQYFRTSEFPALCNKQLDSVLLRWDVCTCVIPSGSYKKAIQTELVSLCPSRIFLVLLLSWAAFPTKTLRVHSDALVGFPCICSVPSSIHTFPHSL